MITTKDRFRRRLGPGSTGWVQSPLARRTLGGWSSGGLVAFERF
jgi:hypothetical protein